MFKKLVPIFLVLFINNVVAGELSGLGGDLRLLKNNLLLMSDKIALTDDEIITLADVDTLMMAAKREVDGLDSRKVEYEGYFSELEAVRNRISKNISGQGFDLSKLNEKEFVEIKRLEVEQVNNTSFLFDAVACPDEYSLDEWQVLTISKRRIDAIKCSIESRKEKIYKYYLEYLKETPDLNGEVSISFIVDDRGSIHVKSYRSGLPEPLVLSIIEEFKAIKTPILGLITMNVEYTLELLPEKLNESS